MRVFLVKTSLLASLVLLFACAGDGGESSTPPSGKQLAVRGIDSSFQSQLAACQTHFSEHPGSYPWQQLQDAGFNTARLRVWVDPVDGFNDLQDTLNKAQAAQDAGMQVLIDFHYSDWWADPGKQTKPAAWQNLSFEELETALYQHTLSTLNALADAKIAVSHVQLGNEIIGGMLWDEGRVGGEFDGNWWRLANLLKQGHRAVQQSRLSPTPKVTLHIDRGGDHAASQWFFSNVLSEGVEFDVIGLSYYPWWHGSLNDLLDNVDRLSAEFEQEIVLAEVAYPHSLDNADDEANFVWQESQLQPGYPASPEGQAAFFEALSAELLQRDKVAGMVYWAPAWLGDNKSGCSSVWDNLTLFDQQGRAQPALSILGQGRALLD